MNGLDADPNTWPWIVSLTFQESAHLGTDLGALCGGTILNNEYILTAAHCCDFSSTNIIINFGQYRQDDPDAGEFRMDSQTVFIHPQYSKSAFNFDACLVKAPRDIFAEAQNNGCGPDCVNSACLPEAPAVHGDSCWVAGWGLLEEMGSLPNTLQSVGVNILSSEYCTAKSHLTNNDLCK